MEKKEKKRFYTKRTVSDSLSRYTYVSDDKEDFIEVSEWVNSEGYDITIGNDRIISLSDSELRAINHLVNCLLYDFETDEKEYRLDKVYYDDEEDI